MATLALGGEAPRGQATGAVTGKGEGGSPKPLDEFYPTHYHTERYSYFERLPRFDVHTPLEPNEMRISFMGTAIPPFGRAQRMMSVYVEVGWEPDGYQNSNPNNPPGTPLAYRPQDQFIFDCGPGVLANYIAMNVPFHRMNKIFINHLHGDHMSELAALYGLGASGRLSPLFVFGQSASLVDNPGDYPLVPGNPPRYSSEPSQYEDGTFEFCRLFRECNRWQSEAFSFQATSYASYIPPTKESWGLPCDPIPIGDDPINDAMAVIPVELDWTKTGLDAAGKLTGDNIAYWNRTTGAKVSHFPVIHCRQGSMGFRLDWTPPGATEPLTMIYSSDTKPEWNSVYQAVNEGKGVDVFIHEMVVPPEVWSMKMQGLSSPDDISDEARNYTTDVQDSSHTTQAAFGYILKQIRERTPGHRLPRLSVATHFPTTDDTVNCAYRSVMAYVPDIGKIGEKLTWSYDCMVIRVFPDRIQQLRGDVSDYNYFPTPSYPFYDKQVPKYHKDDGTWHPLKQINTEMAIPSTQDGGYDGQPTYDEEGY